MARDDISEVLLCNEPNIIEWTAGTQSPTEDDVGDGIGPNEVDRGYCWRYRSSSIILD
jgi:hypothetical protein